MCDRETTDNDAPGLRAKYADLATRAMGNDPMTAYVYELVMNGLGDDTWSSWWGDWSWRFGRRVLCGDAQGFITLDKYPTVAEAVEYMENLPTNDDEEGDEQ